MKKIYVKIKRTLMLILVIVLLLVLYLHSQVDPLESEKIVQDVSVITGQKLDHITINTFKTSNKLPTTSESIHKVQLDINVRSSSVCPDLKHPTNVQDAQTFQMVDGNSNMYVFSAYYDNINQPPILLIVGLQERYPMPHVYCQLWYKGEMNVSVGNVQKIPEDHGLKYSAMYIKCPISSSSKPYAVSVSTESCHTPTNLLKVIYTEKTSNFTVCVTPFNFRYSRAYELVEWIEMNRMLGADYFTFYNHSTGRNVESVLKLYADKGLVNVVQWPLPMKVDHWPPAGKPEVHYFAQLASLNDCVYRNLHRSKYVVFEDLDEIIVPREAKNWTALLNTRLMVNKKYGAFIFRCNFFRKDWPLLEKDFKGKEKAKKYRSIFLFTTTKEQHIHAYQQRSKFIVDPRRVTIVGIHNIWMSRSETATDKVPPDLGLLHHYRNWEKPNEKIPQQQDMHMHTFADTLLERLEDIWSQLKDVRLDIPLSEYPKPV